MALHVPLEPLHLREVAVAVLVGDLEEVGALVEEDGDGLGEADLEAVGPGEVEDGEGSAGVGVGELVEDLATRQADRLDPLVELAEHLLLVRGVDAAGNLDLGGGLELGGGGRRGRGQLAVIQLAE